MLKIEISVPLGIQSDGQTPETFIDALKVPRLYVPLR